MLRRLPAVLVPTIALACSVPSTLGLPCTIDAHCDRGQVCAADGTCQLESDESSGTLGPTTGTTEDGATSLATGTTGSSSDTLAVDASTDTGTTGAPQCGRAVGSCDALDILFVIDNSGSMDDEISRLIPAFVDFTDLLDGVLDGPCSYHIGITTTEVAPDYQPRECQVRGALSRSGALLDGQSCWGDPEHPPYVTEEDPISVLGCLFTVGQFYDTDEKLLQTTLAALAPGINAADGCNEGFLRENAGLLVVFITDEDDDDDSLDPLESPARTGSAGDPTIWFEALSAIKPPAQTGVMALVADAPDACPAWEPHPGLSDGVGAEYAERVLFFMQHYTGVGFADHVYSANICDSSDEIMAQIANVAEVIDAVCTDAGA